MINKNGIISGKKFNEGYSNISIVGSPTIDNNILSNTSKNNYVSFGISSTDLNWEFNIGFKPQTVVQSYNSIISRGNPGFQLYTKNGNNTIILELNGSLGLFTFDSISFGTKYNIKISYNGTTVTGVLTGNNTSVTKTATQSNLSLNGTWRFGITQSGNYGYDGLIYLDETYFKVGGEIFSPALDKGTISDYQITSKEFCEI